MVSDCLLLFPKRKVQKEVLILVVMEYGLRQPYRLPEGTTTVLILVVMEYGLRPARTWQPLSTKSGLNPCCNGIWSQTGTLVICCAVVL